MKTLDNLDLDNVTGGRAFTAGSRMLGGGLYGGGLYGRGLYGRGLYGYGGASPLLGMMNGGWTLNSVIASGRDIADAPIEIRAGVDVSGVVVTFTDHPSELSGTVLDAAGRATPGCQVPRQPARCAASPPCGSRCAPETSLAPRCARHLRLASEILRR